MDCLEGKPSGRTSLSLLGECQEGGCRYGSCKFFFSYGGTKRPDSGDRNEVPVSPKAGKLCFRKGVRIKGQLPLHVPSFPFNILLG